MRQFLGKLSRKTIVIVGIVLGVVLLSGIGVAAAAALHTPSAQAAQSDDAQVNSALSATSASSHRRLVRVVSITGDQVTVTPSVGKNGQQKTLTISGSTKILKDGQPAKLSDIQANEWMIVRGADATHIRQINILGFGAQGTIQQLGTNSFTLLRSKQSGTGTVTINVSSSTIIQEGQIRVSLSNLQTGEQVVVFGNQASGGALNALLVHVSLVSGKVTAINGSSITLSHGAKGTEISVTTSASTKYYRAGQAVAASQLQVGDSIGVAGTVSNKTSVTATAIFIREPHVVGKVQSVSGDTITLKANNGATIVVTVNGSTKYLESGKAASLSDVHAGSVIEVVGAKTGDDAMTAFLIRIHA